MTNANKRAVARELYMRGLPGADIARILDVTPNTVSNWTVEGGWRTERADQLSRRKNRVDLMAGLIDYQLEALHGRVQQNRENPDGPAPIDKGEIDALVKMFSAIKGRELTWGNVVDVVRELLAYLREKDADLARAVLPHTDDYLMTKRDTMTA